MADMLRLEDVHFSYKGKRVLSGISCSLETGTTLFLRGANGAGKTTLLRMLAGALSPHKGGLFWHNERLVSTGVRIGYVPAGASGFYPRLKARENLEYFGALAGLDRATIRLRILEEDPFGIDYWDLPLEECSQGMRQKLNWVRALALHPEILLLDEPLNGFDQRTEEAALRVLERKDRVTIIAQHGRELPYFSMKLDAGVLVRI